MYAALNCKKVHSIGHCNGSSIPSVPGFGRLLLLKFSTKNLLSQEMEQREWERRKEDRKKEWEETCL